MNHRMMPGARPYGTNQRALSTKQERALALVRELQAAGEKVTATTLRKKIGCGHTEADMLVAALERRGLLR